MLVKRILRFHIRIFRAVGLFPKDILVNSNIKSLCSIRFLTVNIVLFYGLMKVASQPERFFWADYSATANVFRVLQIMYTFLMSIVIHFWIVSHFEASSNLLKEISQIQRRVQYMGLKTFKYNSRCTVLRISYFVVDFLYLISFVIVIGRVIERKVNPDLITEALEFLQRLVAQAIAECFSSFILALSYCVTCINEELNIFLLRQKHRQHLRLFRLHSLLQMSMKVEPLCEELNKIFGLPIAIIFCGLINAILNTSFYFYIILFTSFDVNPLWHTIASLGGSMGMFLPVLVGMVHLCGSNAGLRIEVSFF